MLGGFNTGPPIQFAKFQEFSNMRALRIFERKVLFSVLSSRTIFERDLCSSDSVTKFATQKSWVFLDCITFVDG